MAPPKNPPAKLPAQRKAPGKATGVVGMIGTAANAIADRVPTAQKNAERKMRGKPQGGAARG